MGSVLVLIALLCAAVLVVSSSAEQAQKQGERPLETLDFDNKFMARAIELAKQAVGKTSPNPCVGCVIVDSNNKVIGEGYHKKAGQPHAEIEAIRSLVNGDARGATAYVSLEPCNHFGRTPPCTQALIKAGIKRVVAAMVDPDARVSGMGLQKLSDNNLSVTVCTDENNAEAKALNGPYIYRVLTKRPYCVCWTDRVQHRKFSRPSYATVLSNLELLAKEVDTLILRVSQTDAKEVMDFVSSLPTSVRIVLIPAELGETLKKLTGNVAAMSERIVIKRLSDIVNAHADPTIAKIRLLALTGGLPDRPVYTVETLAADKLTATRGDDTNGDSDSDGGNPLFDLDTTICLSTLHKCVSIGCNAGLIFLDGSQLSLEQLAEDGYVQKMCVTVSDKEAASALAARHAAETVFQKVRNAYAGLDEDIEEPAIDVGAGGEALGGSVDREGHGGSVGFPRSFAVKLWSFKR